MAFPSSTGTKASLQKAWQSATDNAAMIKYHASALRNASAAGNVGATSILDMLVTFAQCKDALNAAAAVTGISAYAQTQISNPTYNVATEFTAMIAQLDAARDWAIANFPKDGSGYLLERTLGADGRWVDRQFSTAALAAFRTVLDALIATID